jgi:hypothetical protein
MNKVQIAAKLYEYRDSVRFILGTRYPAKMAELGEVIREVAKAGAESELAAAMRIAKGENEPQLTMLLMAAFVEMTEPSANAD